MIFRTYEHYPHNELCYNIIFDNNYDNLCIICFENNNLLNEIIHLNNQTLYGTQCKCNAKIHNHCLEAWYDRTQKCPICRVIMINKVGTLKKTTLFIIKCIKIFLPLLYVLTIFDVLYGCLLYLY